MGRIKRHPTGLIVIDKPAGPSSMDLVRRVRRAGRGVKTGHAGTLDPLATGIVICCLGRATKAAERLMGLAKTYEATIDLTAFTTTDDAEGQRQEVPVAAPPESAAIADAARRFEGWIEQVPPAHSAVHVAGQRAYELARAGEAVELPSRTVRVQQIEPLQLDWPEIRLRVTCGKGTYLRSLARDLGQALGTGGHLASLRRTAVGDYTLDHAWELDQLPEPLTEEHLLPAPLNK